MSSAKKDHLIVLKLENMQKSSEDEAETEDEQPDPGMTSLSVIVTHL